MKLVSAKCPNCGAQIEVDKNSDSTVCDYCNSRIIVEDALEKYKVEISGSIEVENLPKLDNFLKIAERCFIEKDYNEAYIYYTKVIELDPENADALVRKGICKAIESGYEKFELDAMINGLKYAYEYIKENRQSTDKYVSECFEIVKMYDNLLVEKYKQRNLSQSDITPFNEKIRKCVNAYEYLNQIVESESLKIDILKCLIQAMKNLLLNKEYRTVVNGRSVIRSCCWNTATKKQIEEEKFKYKYELNMIINPEQAKRDLELRQKAKEREGKLFGIFKIKEENLNIIYYIFAGFCGFLAIVSLLLTNIVALIMFLFVGIMSLPPIMDIYKNKEYKTRVSGTKIIVFIAAFFALLIFSSTIKEYEGRWNAGNGMYVELKDEKATVVFENGKKLNGTYTVNKEDDDYTINVKIVENDIEREYVFKYDKDSEKVKFYLEQNGEPCIYYKPEKGNSSYTYVTK